MMYSNVCNIFGIVPAKVRDAAPMDPPTEARAAELLREHQKMIWKRTDRIFAGLLGFEWLAGILLALWKSPRTWDGTASRVHPHLWAAILLGGVIVSLPMCLACLRPGRASTRHVIAIAQMLMSALFIDIGDGRIEMHFHIFGSLAFLAFYRDWRVLITASAVVTLDHLVRGALLPETLYGTTVVNPWRWAEHASWVVFEDIFLVASCIQGVREMSRIAQRQALLEASYKSVEETVRQRTHQLKTAQDDLLKVARSAGMAEIATSVLHNVGNVLNSVNVSVSLASTKVQQYPVNDLSRAIRMMNEHSEDLGFMSRDERGRQIPGFLGAVAEILSSEQTALIDEMASLTKNVEHIKRIVNVQQSHAKVVDAEDEVDIEALVTDALQVNAVSMQNHIETVMEIEKLPPVITDKHAVLQILINLISNAKHAVMNNPPECRRITVKVSQQSRDDRSWMQLEVVDNGIGIDPENITRIFNHGFTTKRDGHGFGLHASANAAKHLQGSLTGSSDGVGHGATFTLKLPMEKEMVHA